MKWQALFMLVYLLGLNLAVFLFGFREYYRSTTGKRGRK